MRNTIPKSNAAEIPILLAQVQAGNNSINLLNEIRQIVFSLHQAKQISKKVYNKKTINTIKTIKVYNKNKDEYDDLEFRE